MRSRPSLILRAGKRGDIAALCAIERRAFTHDRLSARSFARFLRSPGASLIVAEAESGVSGYALTLFRKRGRVARLYSIAVDPTVRGRKLGSSLLTAVEAAAFNRRSKAMHLEVKPRNRRALSLYRKRGYRVVGELGAYYEDGGKALRLEKALELAPPRLR
jgi:ribosomal protein S18 acetylase RimI-like enzyme